MSVLERMESTQGQVEVVRDRLDQARHGLDHVEAVVEGLDDALQIADDLLDHAMRITRSSRRWVPVAAVALGVVAGVAVGAWWWRRRTAGAARAQEE